MVFERGDNSPPLFGDAGGTRLHHGHTTEQLVEALWAVLVLVTKVTNTPPVFSTHTHTHT